MLPFCLFQGTSFSNSLEWDECGGDGSDSADSVSSAYYHHLMNELQSVLVSKGKSRITPKAETPKTPSTCDKPSMATSTPFVAPRTLNLSLELTPLSSNNNTTEEPTPKPRSKYAAGKIEQMTYVSPATLNEGSPMPIKSLASIIAQRAQQMDQIEETFEDETIFEDAEDN